jgi:hypothetical protein
VGTQPFFGQLSSGPKMENVRSIVHARFRSPVSRIPLALNLLEPEGLVGMFALVAREASGFSQFFQRHSRRKGRSRLLARIDGLLEAIGRRMKPAKIAAEKTRSNESVIAQVVRRARLAVCRESSNVCVSLGQQIARLKEEHI